MKTLIAILMVAALASAALAIDLGNARPDKPHVIYPAAPPSAVLQGGDSILDAVQVDLPYSGTGTTVGFTDDYDEVCPYTGSTSPDVVYSMLPPSDIDVDIDMLGSTYDTKIYVYDENLALVACNDDFYPDYVSKLEQVALMGGVEYFLVIDGYGGDQGDYVLDITEFEPCEVDCPSYAQMENEPPLVDGYVDLHNGGCNTEGVHPFGWIDTHIYCGTSGWYLSPDGSQFRDTDWFEIMVPYSGFVEIVGDAEFATYMFELGPQDCDNVAVIQNVTMGPCLEASITIPAPVGDTIWFWVGPTTFDGTGEYDYILYTNLGGCPAVESHSWSGVKSLFD